MQKLHQLLQQAFAKIDASDPKMRQKVYENIWLMQEKSLAAAALDAAQKQEKRRRLTQMLKTAEAEYRAAAQAPAEPSLAAAEHLRAERGGDVRAGSREDSSLFYLEQEVNKKIPENRQDIAPPAWRRVKPGTYCIAVLTLLVAAFVAWSFYNSFGAPARKKLLQNISTAPMQQNNRANNGWTEVFNPANVSGLAVRGQASADLHNEPDANFIRISGAQAEDMAIIDIGRGALLPLRGRNATFKLVARNADNAIGQLKLVADFGNGAVSRYRFELSPTAASLLFTVPIPRQLSAGARFYIGGDKESQRSQVDIFALLLRKTDSGANGAAAP